MRELLNIGDDCARWSDPLGIFIEWNFVELERIALLAESYAMIGMSLHFSDRVSRVRHFQGTENAFANELLPRLA